MGQESLTTSAIPPNLMSIPDILSLTYHHTHLIDNGIESRPSYLEHPSRSVGPHGVHSFSFRLFRFHHPDSSPSSVTWYIRIFRIPIPEVNMDFLHFPENLTLLH